MSRPRVDHAPGAMAASVANGCYPGMNEPRDGRARVLSQARILFVERGYADTSMQQIAEAAGLRKATLYHHFKDKEELFTQVLLVELQELSRELDRAIASGGTLAERLEAVAYVNFAEITRPDVYRLARDFWQHVPESKHQEIHQELHGLMAKFTDLFRNAADNGEIVAIDPQVVAVLFFHMVMGWATQSIDDPSVEPPDPRYAAQTVVQVLLQGVAKDLGRRSLAAARKALAGSE
jgi:AcrR family transcriptional regulator